MVLLFFIVLILYSFLITSYFLGFKKARWFDFNASTTASTAISILIPYRIHTDFDTLKALVQSILSQKEAHHDIEIILIDDFSSIATPKIENTSQICLKDHRSELSDIKNNKKESLEYGVSLSKYNKIVCLDADILLSSHWLNATLQFIEKYNPKFAAGIHRYSLKGGFFNQFLALEQDNLTAISIGSLANGSPTMCNGANMIFDKSSFIEIGRYQGLYHINGGDDMFLYHRMFEKYPLETYYIKSLENAVYSDTAPSFVDFIKQRNRWLSKSLDYERTSVTWQLALVFITNVLVVISFLVLLLHPPFIVLISLKIIIDVCFLHFQRRFFNTQTSFFKLLIMATMYPFYVSFIGFYALYAMIKVKYLPLQHN